MKYWSLVLILLFSSPFSAVAADSKASGAGCSDIKMGPEGYRKAIQLAAKVQDVLNASTAEVVLLGRAGSNSPQERFSKKISYWNYTHAGLAYRHHPVGPWTLVHLLNTCDQASGVFVESLAKFYLDDPYEYRTVIAIPSVALQQALNQLVLQQQLALAFYQNSVYSSISYPFSLERQNSNEYILDTLVAAHALLNQRPAYNRAQSKAYLLSSPLKDLLQPEELKVGFFESLGTSMGLGPGNATLADHTPLERSRGRMQMVSVGTLIQLLADSGHLNSVLELALRDMHKAKDTQVNGKVARN